MNSPKPIVERLLEAARNVEHTRMTAWADNLAGWEHITIREAADHITSLEADNARMREALVYVRKSLGDPLPIGRRHVARVVDAALSPRGES